MYKGWVILYSKKGWLWKKICYDFIMGHRIDDVLNQFKEGHPKDEVLLVFVEYNHNYFKDEELKK